MDLVVYKNRDPVPLRPFNEEELSRGGWQYLPSDAVAVVLLLETPAVGGDDIWCEPFEEVDVWVRHPVKMLGGEIINGTMRIWPERSPSHRRKKA